MRVYARSSAGFAAGAGGYSLRTAAPVSGRGGNSGQAAGITNTKSTYGRRIHSTRLARRLLRTFWRGLRAGKQPTVWSGLCPSKRLPHQGSAPCLQLLGRKANKFTGDVFSAPDLAWGRKNSSGGFRWQESCAIWHSKCAVARHRLGGVMARGEPWKRGPETSFAPGRTPSNRLQRAPPRSASISTTTGLPADRVSRRAWALAAAVSLTSALSLCDLLPIQCPQTQRRFLSFTR